jgi:ABC-type branched-subunit amino acid transport system substrate-binding protein
MAAGLGLGLGPLRVWASDASLPKGAPFKLGWVRPTTGRLASSFAPLYIGGLIAVDEINAAGGILGHPIARVEEDDEASPAKEPAIIKKLQEAGVSYLCGPTGSSQALASFAVTTPAKMIQTGYAVAAGAGDGTKYPYHYQFTFNTDQQGQVAAHYLVETLKVKKVGILQENTAYGEQATAASKTTLEKLGIKPLTVEVYPLTAPDLNGYIANLRKAGCEGIIAWIANVPNGAMAFNAMAALKWYPPIAGHSGLFLDKIFDLVPVEAIQNVYATYYKTLTWTAGASPGARQVEYAKKIAKYPEAKGFESNVAAAPFYDFLHLLKKVIEDEKTFDTAVIKRALDSVKGYKSMLGTVNLSPTNHSAISIEDMTMATITSGKDPKSLGPFRERAKGL